MIDSTERGPGKSASSHEWVQNPNKDLLKNVTEGSYFHYLFPKSAKKDGDDEKLARFIKHAVIQLLEALRKEDRELEKMIDKLQSSVEYKTQYVYILPELVDAFIDELYEGKEPSFYELLPASVVKLAIEVAKRKAGRNNTSSQSLIQVQSFEGEYFHIISKFARISHYDGLPQSFSKNIVATGAFPRKQAEKCISQGQLYAPFSIEEPDEKQKRFLEVAAIVEKKDTEKIELLTLLLDERRGPVWLLPIQSAMKEARNDIRLNAFFFLPDEHFKQMLRGLPEEQIAEWLNEKHALVAQYASGERLSQKTFKDFWATVMELSKGWLTIPFGVEKVPVTYGTEKRVTFSDCVISVTFQINVWCQVGFDLQTRKPLTALCADPYWGAKVRAEVQPTLPLSREKVTMRVNTALAQMGMDTTL
jgi:hypothetical protein